MTIFTTAGDATHNAWLHCEFCGRPTAVKFVDNGIVAPSDFWAVMLGVHVEWCGFCREEAARAASTQ